MGTAQNIQRDAAAASSQVPQEATNANAVEALIPVEELQASQQPVSPRN